MDLFDLGRTPTDLASAFQKCTCRWLVMSFTSDWLFPPEQSRDIVDALVANRFPVSFCNIQSACGHDAFLLPDELEIYGGMSRAFLENLTPSDTNPNSGTRGTGDAHGPTSIFHQHRLDYDRMVELIPPGSSVLDLGCGSGALLARLKEEHAGRLVGVELDERNILNCISRGLDVIQADLNKGLKAFCTGQFDCVVLSQTLQAVYDVEGLLTEMLRIGKTCIVSIPNFAYRQLRSMLTKEGRAPKASGVLRYEWHNTPNIRFFTIADFEDFCRERDIKVHRQIALDTEASREVFEDPNLNADLAIFVISRAS